MKFLLIILVVGSTASAEQAQLLPAPHQKNPDWTLQKMEAPTEDGATMMQPVNDDMPNAMQKGISSIGNRHHVWDSKRQLVYEWISQPNEMAPDKLVLVSEQRTGTVYTYVRKKK